MQQILDAILAGDTAAETFAALPLPESYTGVTVHADEGDILRWYVERFLALRQTVFRNEHSFFRHFAALDDEEAVQVATGIWNEINRRNLVENIRPTRERAHLILEKGRDHGVRRVRLRKV